MKINIENNEISISIPYKPSKYFNKTKIGINDIECIINGYMWPALKTKTNEIIIFPFSDGNNKILFQYANENNIQIVDYYDIWSDILEPFLDSEYSEETKIRIDGNLHDFGLDKSEVKKIRAEIEEIMIDYNMNSGLWDWVNLNMNDLLDACIGKLNKNIKMTEDYFEEYYWFIMAIQEKGRRRTTAST